MGSSHSVSALALQAMNPRAATDARVDGPTQVVRAYLAMADDGRQASPEGCPELARLALDHEKWCAATITVVRDYGVLGESINGEGAEVTVEAIAVGELDPRTLAFKTDSILVGGIKTRGSVHLSRRPESGATSVVVRWYLDDPTPFRYVTVAGAQRFVSAARDKAVDPATRTRATRTLASLRLQQPAHR